MRMQRSQMVLTRRPLLQLPPPGSGGRWPAATASWWQLRRRRQGPLQSCCPRGQLPSTWGAWEVVMQRL